MEDVNLPKHVIEKLERRWAAQLAQKAGCCREGHARPAQREITSRTGPPALVSRRRTPTWAAMCAC